MIRQAGGTMNCRLAWILLVVAAGSLGVCPLPAWQNFGLPGYGRARSPIHYYAPNNKASQWQGNKATIVVFNFGRVRQGEVWLSKEGVGGKSVLSCAHNGYLMALYLAKAMHAAQAMAQSGTAEANQVAATKMGEHVAEYIAEMDEATPVVRIDFGPQNSSERHSYRFNLPATYRLINLLGTMCGSLRGHGFRHQSASIRHLLKPFAQYDPAKQKASSPDSPPAATPPAKGKKVWLN